MRHADRSDALSIGIVEPLPKFDICDTLSELQLDFRAIWNQVVQEAQKDGDLSIPVWMD